MNGDLLRRLARFVGAFCLAAAGTGAAWAQGDKYAPIRDQLEVCETCHGAQGRSEQAQYPILAGEHSSYLYVQLQDYKSGLRENSIMQPLAEPLDKEQMQLLAQYYSKQEWPAVKAKTDKQAVQTGKRVISAGQCIACHLGSFEGNSRVPRLRGQHFDYLVNTMLDFKHKLRRNSPTKSSLFQGFSAEEIEATARYLRGHAGGS